MSAACCSLRLALLVLLAGCAAQPEAQRHEESGMQIVWLQVDDVHGVCQGLAGRKEFLTVLGCSRWSAEQRRCEIYAPAPRSERDLERFATLGHELMHCFEGNWHDRWGRMHDARTRQVMR